MVMAWELTLIDNGRLAQQLCTAIVLAFVKVIMAVSDFRRHAYLITVKMAPQGDVSNVFDIHIYSFPLESCFRTRYIIILTIV